MKNKRLDPKDRRELIMVAALSAATDKHINQITRADIAARAQVTPALVQHYLGTMPKLKRAVMRAAVDREVLVVVAQGLLARDPYAMKAPAELKKRAINEISC